MRTGCNVKADLSGNHAQEMGSLQPLMLDIIIKKGVVYQIPAYPLCFSDAHIIHRGIEAYCFSVGVKGDGCAALIYVDGII